MVGSRTGGSSHYPSTHRQWRFQCADWDKPFSGEYKKHGYDVIQAHDGREGIELASYVVPALILLDIQLPLLDGYAVARELRSKAALADIPIIAVTSYA